MIDFNLKDTTYSLRPTIAGNLTFLNDSMVYVANNFFITLYNLNSGASFELEIDRDGDYEALAYDQTTHQLFVFKENNPFDGLNEWLILENNAIVQQTDIPVFQDIDWLDLDIHGNMFATWSGIVYRVNKSTGLVGDEFIKL